MRTTGPLRQSCHTSNRTALASHTCPHLHETHQPAGYESFACPHSDGGCATSRQPTRRRPPPTPPLSQQRPSTSCITPCRPRKPWQPALPRTPRQAIREYRAASAGPLAHTWCYLAEGCLTPSRVSRLPSHTRREPSGRGHRRRGTTLCVPVSPPLAWSWPGPRSAERRAAAVFKIYATVYAVRHGLTPWPARPATGQAPCLRKLPDLAGAAAVLAHSVPVLAQLCTCLLTLTPFSRARNATHRPRAHTCTAAHARVHVHTHMCACVSEGIVRSMSS